MASEEASAYTAATNGSNVASSQGEDLSKIVKHFTACIGKSTVSLLQRSLEFKHVYRHVNFDLVQWMQAGGPWRVYLVLNVGLLLMLLFSGFVTFMLFFLAATVNAIGFAFLGSVASMGAFTALFFTLLGIIYLGALNIAIFSISTITFLCVCTTMITAGLIAFLWATWQAFRMGIEIPKASIAFAIPSVRTLPFRRKHQRKNIYY